LVHRSKYNIQNYIKSTTNLYYFLFVTVNIYLVSLGMVNSNLNKAKNYCANYWSGNCMGAMMQRKEGKLVMWLDNDKKGKPCNANEGCDYFENIVVKSIDNG